MKRILLNAMRIAFAVLAVVCPAALRAQNNTLDLRLAEFDKSGNVTYQNFIYTRSFAGGKWIAQALYLRLPADDYSEVALGAGRRVVERGDVALYFVTGVGKGTDDTYAEPSLLLLDTKGKFTSAVFVQRYIPLSAKGVAAWLIDSAEMQYAIAGPLSLGVGIYGYQPKGADWFTKIGPKVGLNDRYGTTEVRISSVHPGGGTQFLVRRIVVF